MRLNLYFYCILLSFYLFFNLASSYLNFVYPIICFLVSLILLGLLLFRLCFIEIKIILLLLNLLPLAYFSYIVNFLWNLVTDFFSLLPLLFLLFRHYITFGWFIHFCLSYSIYEASLSCLFTHINLPHLKIPLVLLSFILFICLI